MVRSRKKKKKKKRTNMSSVIPRARAIHLELPLKCAWCGEVRAREGSWRTPSNWDPRESGFSHGICPRCFRREQAALKKKR
jgi:hypothetical protein